ncbi:trypsin-like serine peptidase [Flavilitoribacter nigricans]|uniref:Peptidase S1 domain-containing protein n=1 Tax=Flavilitoribacter nigricans (strain ATCC 23147 / DSM 23189 / NBRC 102662 / NCIMB 1420 / SS-2) TaxID=1122177 RepID=A0A2D0NH92_FLAN2|nr:trypsin-like peptidase domain-containing protein [Flavilitoribacter nigricans]PHN07756.1 hypothetical protein CRP01_04750 [Flavilitoribacter nigricans DSM 23189 = NBRC 102662]
MHFRSKDRDEHREIVLFSDDRLPVRDTTAIPHRWVCSLEVEFPEPVLYPLGPLEQPGKQWQTLQATTEGCGSGLLISPRHVLTSAHVIAGLKRVQSRHVNGERFQLVPASRVKVMPGRNEMDRGHNWPLGTYTSRRVLTYPGFKQILESPLRADINLIKNSLSQDVGLVELSDWTDTRLGWWGANENYHLREVPDKLRRRLIGRQAQLAGYPGEKGPIACGAAYRSSGRIVEAFHRINNRQQDLIFYLADTSAGMSGSPVWIRETGNHFRLVGVHSSFLDYRPGSKANVAALLSPAIYKWIGSQGVFPEYVLEFSKNRDHERLS